MACASPSFPLSSSAALTAVMHRVPANVDSTETFPRSHSLLRWWHEDTHVECWECVKLLEIRVWHYQIFFFLIDTERLPGQQSVAMIVFTDWAKIEIKMFLKDISMMIEIVTHLYMFHAHVAGSLHAQMIRKPKWHHKRVTLSSKMFLSHLIICGWKAWCLGITLKLKNTMLSSFDL